MTSFVGAFYWIFLFVTVSATSKTSVQNNGKGTTVSPADNKCSTVINAGNYYAGTNKEIKTILQGIQAQLSDVQDQLREMNTANENKTGEKEEIVTNSVSLTDWR